MNKVIVTSDSTSDLSPGIIEKLDIKIIPLYVNIGDDSYKDGVDIKQKDVFESFEKDGVLAKTSAISVYDFKLFFEYYLKQGYEIVHFSISSLFSSCHQNAINASQYLETDRISFIDSINLSSGIGHQVIRAGILAKKGASRQEIVEDNESIKAKVNSSFVIDSLTYLAKGGRCPGLVAQGANLIKLKPCIEVIGGTMKVGKQYRGSLERCLNAYIDDRLRDIESIDSNRVFITHTVEDEELVERIVEKVENLKYFDEILITEASCTISCHCGPGTLGILYIEK